MDKSNLTNDLNIINYIIEQIDICESFVKNLKLEAFLKDIKTCYAVSMVIQVICETTNKISDNVKKINENIEWKKMSGLRNLISHDYGSLMFEDMYNTAINDLPLLKSELLSLAEKVK